jgi:F-type H+-transporting ATPase subunit b
MINRALIALAALLLAVPALAAEGEGAEAPNLFSGDLGNSVWTLLIFAVVLVVLGKYAWGPILKSLQARETFIAEALEKAKREHEVAEQRLRTYEEKLAQARVEASAIVDEGRRDAEVLKNRILDEARAEAEKERERTRREIRIATDTATKELYTLASRLATDMAGRIVGKVLTPQDQERLIAESIAELNAAAPQA